jgi:hypothetical protein
MRLTDLLPGRSKPTLVAAVYPSEETAIEAADAARGEGEADDIRVVGPLEQVIGNEPAPTIRGAWAVVVRPQTFPQSFRIARALRHSMRRRRSDRAMATPQSASPAAAGLVADRP